MSKRESTLSSTLWGLAFILCLTMTRQHPIERAAAGATPARFGASVLLGQLEPLPTLDRTDSVVRTALRLQQRLWRRGSPAPIALVMDAVRTRRELLGRSLTVSFLTETGETTPDWQASAHRYPLWIKTIVEGGSIRVQLDQDAIRSTLTSSRVIDLPAPRDAHLTSLVMDGALTRARTDQPAKPGHRIDVSHTAELITSALEQDLGALAVSLIYTPGLVLNDTGIPLGDLTLLGTGHSNFAGSPPGRIANVRKALREHVHNTIVPPGGTFSFNATLGGSVSLRSGWQQAKVIKEGELIIEPGGGICQASTTVFRSILDAGFAVEKHKNHSMYVSYYEVGGVGLDATVYIGQQDLTFTNDTGDTLLLQAYDDGHDAYVRIYGTSDGRVASLGGPFFRDTLPQGLPGGRKLHANEIGWVQSVAFADGSVVERPIVSRYKALPRSIVYKYSALSAR